ncbi:MAG: hypothetical protein LBS67_00215 [Clostridiales Family XIII bacterium]|jgi:hypothetical protein|nr:hypothetical protein [Clostridiales Family XIII bacterium]
MADGEKKKLNVYLDRGNQSDRERTCQIRFETKGRRASFMRDRSGV